MNLYAICPVHAPNNEVSFILADSDDKAIRQGVFEAADDATAGGYGSPSAEVYLIARDLQHVGTAWATDAPREWEWAHPAVEENVAFWACLEAEQDAGDLA